MKINITEIAENCVENLKNFDSIDIDDIYNQAYESVEDIIGDISLEIKDILKKEKIEIKK